MSIWVKATGKGVRGYVLALGVIYICGLQKF